MSEIDYNNLKPEDLVFTPAKEDDVLPEGIWLPQINRKEKRALKKLQKKTSISGLMTGKDALNNKNFRNGLYKDLLTNLKNKEKKLKEENNG